MKIYNYLSKKYHAFVRKKNEKYLQKLVDLGLTIGKNVDIVASHTCLFDPSHCFLIRIGDNCTICPNVRFIAHDASTKLHLGYTKIGKIEIMDNCFIGDSTILLPNVSVGPNSIVGAGSVVKKNVPSGVVVAGNPATIICTIDEYIKKMKTASTNKKIFDENYFIQNLTANRRQEILDSVENSIGYII